MRGSGPVVSPRRPTDEELLTSVDPDAFGAFYARHIAAVEAYFARRVGSRDTAADLAADTFVAALVARRHFTSRETPAAGWLYTIAARRLVDFQRRGAVQRRVRETLAVEARFDRRTSPDTRLADDGEPDLLRHVTLEHRRAITEHVVWDEGYAEIAARSGESEAVIRQRVSRGLRALRSPLLVYRAARALAREDHAYRLGGGHRSRLIAIGARDPLDCSACASLVLLRSGILDSEVAWTSSRLATEWGVSGEGRYVTVWASEEHVWFEFKLDRDHSERFDPTPSRLAPHSGWLATTTRATADCVPRHLPGL